MPVTLFGSRGSGSAAVEMALRATSVDYDLVRASSWEADSAFGQLLELNPLGQIPVLRLEDGTVLTESVAILLYLSFEYPESGLLPVTSIERALDIRGLVYIAANCYPAVSASDFPEQWTTATTKPAQAKVRQAARAQLHRKWDIFADVFGTRLRPDGPGALAFLAVVVSQWSGTRQHLEAERPGFYETLLQLEAHPRLAATLRQHRGA